MAGREVELDSQIDFSQMPEITGTAKESAADEDMAYETSQPLPGPSFLLQAAKKNDKPATPGPSSTVKYVAPTSFYGAPPPKPKAKGPLYAFILFYYISYSNSDLL